MSLSMHDVAIKPCIHMLENLSNQLAKGEAYATERKFEPSLLMNVRLFPDMYELTRQVRSAVVAAAGLARNLSGVEPPAGADNEQTIADLRASIAAVVEYLKGITPDQVNSSDSKEFVVKLGQREVEFRGANYALQFALPNFYFHVTSTYNILRHVGVDIGKRDFLAGYQAK